MNGDVSTVPLTAEIFHKYLRRGPIQNHFAENAGVLMKQMQDLCPPSARARTFGFVIPSLSTDETRAVLALLPPLKLIAEINPLARVHTGDNTVVNYVHITLRNVPLKNTRVLQ